VGPHAKGRLVIETRGALAMVPMLASAVAMQALLSGSNLLVGVILIRNTPDLQYGSYVLMLNGILLLTVLQQSFIQPQFVVRVSRANASERADLVGGLYREQRRLWPAAAALIVFVSLLLWFAGILQTPTFLIVLAAAAAVLATLFREFFRMVLLGYRKPLQVLGADAVYVVLLLGGALLATMTAAPAAVAGLTLAFAALIGGLFCSRALWRFEPWNIHGAPGILLAITPLGAWATTGAAAHWLFSQGYNYLVAAVLHVPAVAALAATRLTIMPVTLVSSGIGTMMLPTTAAWLNIHSAPTVLRRLLLFALGLSVASICYFGVIWFTRDWLFAHVLKRNFPQRDTLLLLWFAVSLMTLLRDQLLYLLSARQRFRLMTTLTLVSALFSILLSYVCMRYFGVIGALLGILAGELLNVIGLVVLSAIESQRHIAVDVNPAVS
jgi:O-antigen/teichoic acid export membrane protein